MNASFCHRKRYVGVTVLGYALWLLILYCAHVNMKYWLRLQLFTGSSIVLPWQKEPTLNF